MAEPQASSAPDAGAATRGKGRRTALVVLLVGVCLASFGASVAYVRWRPKKVAPQSRQQAAAAARKDAAPPRERRDLGEFLVNLADPDGLAFLKTTLVLEFEGAEGGKKGGHGGTEEAPEWDAPVRDAIVTTLSQCFRSELRTAQGKERLKKRLLARINERTKGSGPRFVAVYFTSFAMQ